MSLKCIAPYLMGYTRKQAVLPAVILTSYCSLKPEDINCCFQVLDKEKKGYLESAELTKYMTQEGKEEAFSQSTSMFSFLFILAVPFVCHQTRRGLESGGNGGDVDGTG